MQQLQISTMSSDSRRWASHPDFQDLIQAKWDNNLPFGENKTKMEVVLSHWHKTCFGSINHRKKKLWARLGDIQRSLAAHGPKHLLKLEKKFQKELNLTLNQEELMWHQRSREEWIKSGDRNTKFYHTSKLIRKHRSRIERLKSGDGIWKTTQAEMESLVCDYFRDLFSMDSTNTPPQARPWGRAGGATARALTCPRKKKVMEFTCNRN